MEKFKYPGIKTIIYDDDCSALHSFCYTRSLSERTNSPIVMQLNHVRIIVTPEMQVTEFLNRYTSIALTRNLNNIIQGVDDQISLPEYINPAVANQLQEDVDNQLISDLYGSDSGGDYVV
jgi:hypothetical protein